MSVRRKNEDSADEISSFKAGDLTVTAKEKNKESIISFAKGIYDDAMARLTPLLKDNGFFFGRVDL